MKFLDKFGVRLIHSKVLCTVKYGNYNRDEILLSFNQLVIYVHMANPSLFEMEIQNFQIFDFSDYWPA